MRQCLVSHQFYASVSIMFSLSEPVKSYLRACLNQVESLLDDADLSIELSRQKFESLNDELFSRCALNIHGTDPVKCFPYWLLIQTFSCPTNLFVCNPYFTLETSSDVRTTARVMTGDRTWVDSLVTVTEHSAPSVFVL